MDAYRRLSGDANPLHTEDAFARRAGFDGPVVFGGLIVAKISWLLGMHLPGAGGLWTGLKVNFHKPLYAGESATITGEVTHRSESTGMLTLKLVIEAGDRCIATATAESLMIDRD